MGSAAFIDHRLWERWGVCGLLRFDYLRQAIRKLTYPDLTEYAKSPISFPYDLSQKSLLRLLSVSPKGIKNQQINTNVLGRENMIPRNPNRMRVSGGRKHGSRRHVLARLL